MYANKKYQVSNLFEEKKKHIALKSLFHDHHNWANLVVIVQDRPIYQHLTWKKKQIDFSSFVSSPRVAQYLWNFYLDYVKKDMFIVSKQMQAFMSSV